MDDLQSAFEALHTALMADILDEMKTSYAFLGAEIRGYAPGTTVAGRAFTMTVGPANRDADQPYGVLFDAYRHMKPGDVVVISDVDGVAGVWGELLSVAARARGAVGAVSGGLVRDVDQIVAMNFPLFCRGASPVDSAWRQEIVAFGETVRVGGGTVTPGDVVLGDSMGVIAFDSSQMTEAFDRAARKRRGEDTVRAELAAGDEIGSVFRKYGIL